MRNVIYAAVVLLFLSHCSLQDDLDDDVTVEVEDESDVSYSTPTPSGNYYLAENFDDTSAFKKKWVLSQAKKDGLEEDLAKYDGVWEVEAPRKDALRNDLGLVLKSKAKHAAISAKLDRPFTFNDKPLIVQYEVNFQEGQECGGAYIKLLSQGKETSDLRQFVDTTPYTIMFGPDKCGNDLKLHFIFRHRNPNNGSFEEKHSKKPKERLQEAFEDKKPHLYTLTVNPDNSFQIRVDHNLVNEGNLLEDFTPAVNPPSEIDDPNDRKPATWDEREQIPDPEARKPDDWDEDAPRKIQDPNAKKPSGWLEDEPTMIPDPDAEKPSDWDTDMDGDWEPPLVDNPACEGISGCGKWEVPMIDNPAYKGKWRPSMIDNPNYQGKWRPRRIVNPDYYFDSQPYKMTPISAVGFELWSMSAAILFDNILITDTMSVADDYAAKTYDLKKRKIDADSVSLYGKVMKSINYKPGWWSIYFIYCLVPVVGYGYFLYRRVQEESVLTAFLKYSNERPYLYGVYIILVGLPIALLVVYCCGGPSKDEDDSAKHPKKTDAVSPDDDAPPLGARSKSELGVPDDQGEMDEDDEEEDEDDDEGAGDNRDSSADEEAEAEGARQRKTRKE